MYESGTKLSLVGINMIKILTYVCVPEGSKRRVKVVLKEETLNLFWEETEILEFLCHAT